MTCCPSSQLGVDSVERLKHLDAEDFEMLKKEMKKIPYKLLLEAMKQRGIAKVPTVPTDPPGPDGSRHHCPDPTRPGGFCSGRVQTCFSQLSAKAL